MEVERVRIEELAKDPTNVRLHNEKNIEAIKASLLKFGQQKPIVVDAKNIVVAGNGTLEAAKALGWEDIQLVRTDLKGAMAMGFALADNKTSDLSEFDQDGLNKQLQALQDELDMQDFGFDLPDTPMGSVDGEDDVPEVEENKFGVKLGDIFQLGEHRLMCGDSTDKEQVDKLMNGDKPNSVVTDPPYGIGFDYKDHDDSESEWFDLMNKVIPILKSTAEFVVMPCCRIKALDWWYQNHKPDWLICWYKGSPGHRSAIGFNDWEPHLVWGKPPKQMHDYFQTRCGFEKEARGHPCPKPVEYAQWLVTRAGKLIFDPFCGSGTTLIACEKTNRKCYGMEIDPHYCSVIIERWQNFTGKEAKL